ncbi:MAG: hypothetical protein JJ850_04685 [Kordiimonadaceae bacterium]|nr:hypothetical protein [Kordiimonadaceae bacterium]MBO6568385.1 hypothetical protein [Kordiimonadaceae bacterium]MBO6963886.1 hypothetical protein [Kordiimonadaceae bacterium]
MSQEPHGRKKRLDFVTVTFGEELGLLKLQARSFAHFMPAQLVCSILIVANDDSSDQLARHISETVVPLYGDHAPKVRVLARTDLCGDYQFKHRGWISQQVFKLLAARHVQSDDYVILDTKNHFIRAVAASDFYASNGKLKHRRTNLLHTRRPKWLRWLQQGKQKKLSRRYTGSMRYFGLDPIKFAENSVPKTTPFPMNTGLVRELITHVEEREGVSFSEWFESYFEATEFYLLQAYASYRGLSFQDLYERSKPGIIVLYPESDARLQRLSTTLEMLDNEKQYYCIGVHRKLGACLSAEQKQVLNDFWRKRGLIEDNEDFDTLITDEASNRFKAKQLPSPKGLQREGSP